MATDGRRPGVGDWIGPDPGAQGSSEVQKFRRSAELDCLVETFVLRNPGSCKKAQGSFKMMFLNPSPG